jgi:hypothetical protein
MKKTHKKLTLHRETIGRLTDARLAEAAGGGTQLSCQSHCLTYCNCPSQNTLCYTVGIECNTQTECIGTQNC